LEVIKKELVGLDKIPDNPGSYTETQTIAKTIYFLLYINRYYIKRDAGLESEEDKCNLIYDF